MLRLRATGASEAREQLEGMADRAKDLDGAREGVHAALLRSVPDVGQSTGRLAASLENPLHPEHVFSMRNGEIVFGSDVPYAVFQLARRGVDPVTPQATGRVRAALVDHIEGE